jgi:hypothetical protein
MHWIIAKLEQPWSEWLADGIGGCVSDPRERSKRRGFEELRGRRSGCAAGEHGVTVVLSRVRGR